MSNLSSLAVTAVFVLVGLTACNKDNPNFCEGTTEECTVTDAPPDSPPMACSPNGPNPACEATNPVCVAGECTGQCDEDTDCTGRPATEAVCHVGLGDCVQCDEDGRQATPGAEDECPAPQLAVCDGDTHTCRECRAHDECNSGICDAGRCAPEGEIVFLDVGGADNALCTRAAPCETLNEGVDRVQAMPQVFKYIFMAPSLTPYKTRMNNDQVDFDNVDVYVVGTGASVSRAGEAGHILEVRGTSDVTIDGLTVSNGATTSGHGILCNSTLTLRNATLTGNRGTGIAGSSCTLTMRGSTISLNDLVGIELSSSNIDIARSTIAENDGGGISLSSGTFKIVNNFIIGNGDSSTALVGGVKVASAAMANVLEFNTIALNDVAVGQSDGIDCASAGLTARNNIIIGPSGDRLHAVGVCAHTFTLFSPNNMVAGEMNMVVDMISLFNFVSTTDFHILAGSAAAGRAQNTNLVGESAFDIDGNPRTGSTVDIGADEI